MARDDIQVTQNRCKARLDRVQFVVEQHCDLPDIQPYTVKGAHFVRLPKPTARLPRPVGYKRVRRLVNKETGALLNLQYEQSAPWLFEKKVTLTAPTAGELQPSDLQCAFAALPHSKLWLLELALDFTEGVDEAFVKKHAHFGKSRPHKCRLEGLTYGGRESTKFGRAYSKPEIKGYRVEVQAQDKLLAQHRVKALADVERLPHLLYPKHVRFVGIRWSKLRGYLRRKGLDESAIGEAKRRRASLHRCLRYLKGAGVINPHRFLFPLTINSTIERALERWVEIWRNL